MRQRATAHSSTPDESSSARRTESVMSVLDEAIALYLRLRAVAEDIHEGYGLSGAMRGVLRDLRKLGPQTVPQLARRRPVTRQHIQAISNDLQHMGLVELADNPAHKRSKLIRLTPAGEQALREITAREAAFLSRVDVPISVEELEQAGRVLMDLRQSLESDKTRRLVREMSHRDANEHCEQERYSQDGG
jgi:DNA-binding MarR family transcriptional regulator